MLNRSTNLWAVTLALGFALGLGCGDKGPVTDPDAGSEPGDDIGTEPIDDDPETVLVAGPYSLSESAIVARFVDGALELSFQVQNAGNQAGEGQVDLTLTSLDGETNMATSTPVDVPADGGEVVASVDGAPLVETVAEQAEYLVEYTLVLDGLELHGKRSLLMLMGQVDLVIIAPQELLQGQTSELRAILMDPTTAAPLAGRQVTVELSLDGVSQGTSTEETDEAGNATFDVPAESEGEVGITASVSDDEGQGEVAASVSVVRESKLLVTTDKPLYQPGQTMHLRALGLDRFDKAPLADQGILIEVFDAKGNKVYKNLSQTNAYGVAWGEFKLATQVLLGSYIIRATVGETISEKAVTVDRYALPKFKVDVELEQSWFMAGQTVSGVLRADYFFGKPVSGGTVTVVPYEYLGDWSPLTEIVGQTNDEGLYAIDFDLPNYLVGQPLESGNALVLVEITVHDAAGQEVKQAKQLIVASSPVEIVAIPESGELATGIDNTIFVFVSDPLGAPLEATCTASTTGGELLSDSLTMPAQGPGRLTLTPTGGAAELTLSCDAGELGTAEETVTMQAGEAASAVLVRTDAAVYAVGDTMEISVIATGGHDRVFMDIVRKNQTVLTHTLELEDGTATLQIDLDSEMTEDLVVDVYMLAEGGQFIRDTQVVYVRPASDLSVTVTSDKTTYKPGETAVVDFEVTDEDGEPVQAALGVQVVDEAVFALSEIKPGLLKLYFELEEELAQPTYQIGVGTGFSFGGLFAQEASAEPGSEDEEAAQDTTRAAFAALAGAPLSQNRRSSWSETLSGVSAVIGPHMEILRQDVITDLNDMLGGSNDDYWEFCTLIGEHLPTAEHLDFWGRAMTFQVTGSDLWSCNISVTSRGPDEMKDTADDWTAGIDIWELGRGDWAMPMADGFPENAAAGGGGGDDKSSGSDVRVRSWFPETLFVAPSLITDADGTYQVEIPLADSITQWRMTTLGSSMTGHLGSRTDGIIVFQDFFVDIDFPKYLTRGDEIEFPIAVYNYMEEPQTITVALEPADWFELTGSATESLTLEPGEVRGLGFGVKVTEVGWHSLTVYGTGHGDAQDAIMRTVQVKPDGKAMIDTVSARFDNDGETHSEEVITREITYPENTITGSESVVVKVLPGLSTHVVEGMDSMLRLPGG